MKIAFLGIGLMGSRMSRRLLQAGHAVWVWNRTESACQPLIDQGAQALVDWSKLDQIEVIALCLADDNAVQSIAAQVIPQLHSGQIVVDFSSISVPLTRMLAMQTEQQGATWIDAPVSGGVMGAEQGSLVVFAGGDEQAIKHLQPMFDALAQRVTRMGDSGSGQVSKICNQLIVAATSTLIAEAVSLAEHAGVDATLLAPALAGGFADSKPFQILVPRMASRQFEPVQWKVHTLDKDLSNAVMLADMLGIDIPVAQLAQQRLHQHADAGHADADLASVIQLMTATRLKTTE